MIRTFSVHETQPLASGRVATLQIPSYGKIHSLSLLFTNSGAAAAIADIKSSITNVRLTFNGKDIVNASAQKLYDLYETMGVNVLQTTGVAGCLELNVGALIFTDPAARKVLGFGTKNLNSIQVQVTVGTATNVDAVQAFTDRSPVDEVLGLHCKYLDYPITGFNSTGYATMDTLPRDPSTNYLLVMASDGTSGTIASGEVKLNNATIIEECPSSINALIASNKRLKQVTGYFLYNFQDGDFSIANGIGLPMNGATDLRFKTQFSVAPGAGGYSMTALTMENVPIVQTASK